MNRVEVVGIVDSDLEYSNEVCGSVLYKTFLLIRRKSGTIDKLPVMIPDHGYHQIKKGDLLYVSGTYRSQNNNGKVLLYIFASTIENLPVAVGFMNKVELSGFICKDPIFRITPKGRKLCDIILAVNGTCGRSYYIPCVFWKDNAENVNMLPVGTEIHITGRIQSREYEKNGKQVAYEVSVDEMG